MNDDLLKLLTDSAGSADEMALIQQKLLRSKDLRTQAAQDPRRTTRQGGMFSALARGVGAYNAGQLEREAGEAQAGMAAQRKAVAGLLPTIGGTDAVDVYAAPDDQSAASAAREAMLRGESGADLARRLSLSGMDAFAAPYAADAAAQSKGVPQAINAREQRALTRSLAEMKDRTTRDTHDPYTGISLPDGRVYKLNKNTGQWEITGVANAKPPMTMGGRQVGIHRVFDTGEGSQDHVWNGSAWVPTFVAQPGEAGPAMAPPGATPPPPAPGGAAPAMAPPGPAPMKPATPPKKVLSTAEANLLQDETQQLSRLRLLTSNFKDEYAGQPITGGLTTSLGRVAGKKAAPASYQQSQWWAQYRDMVENIKRKTLAGVAVTPIEKHLFDVSQRIREGTAPEDIRAEFARIISETEGRLGARKEARSSENYNVGAVNVLSGGVPAAPGGKTVVRVGTNKLTGKKVVQFSDGTTEER